MKKLLVLALVFLMTYTAFAADFGNQQVNRIFQSVLDTGGLSQKIKQGQILGRLRTDEARSALQALLEDASYWNRQAGAAGLFYYDDPESQRLLVGHFLEDHMTRDFIREKALAHWAAFFPAVKRAYEAEPDDEKRGKLLELIGAGHDDAGKAFLRSVVGNLQSPDRVEAYTLLAGAAGPEDDAFLRGFLSDPELQLQAMDYLLAHGTAEDLAIFTPYLTPWQEDLTAKAYAALDQWGSPEQKEQVFYTALESPKKEQVFGALASFTNVTSERVLLRLGEISENSPSQVFRKLACLGLLYYDDPRIVPYLKRFLKESYQPRKKDGWDVFMNHMSLGTTALFSYLGEREQEKSFHRAQDKMRDKLCEMIQ